MRCNNCGGEAFSRSEYKGPDLHAPALECASCHVLLLDPAAAESAEEHDSVRMAIAARNDVASGEIGGAHQGEPPTQPRGGRWTFATSR